MKALATRYLNEIVGLAVMALMTVALIAGEADASVENVTEPALIRAEVELQLQLDLDLDRLLDVDADETSHEVLHDLIRIRLHRDRHAAE